MSKRISIPLQAPYSWALVAWLCALGVFVLWLGWVLFSGKAPHENPDLADRHDDGQVVVTLEAPFEPDPDLAFDADQAFVLLGAGQQGLYQTSAPDSVWTLSYPAPRLAAQVIKRGPPEPRRMTRGITVFWKVLDEGAALEGQMEVVEDSHFQASIPIQPLRRDGSPNPFPLVLLRAEEAHSGRLLAESAAVLAVSPGYGCAHCHANAGTAILEVHDKHLETRHMERYAQGEVIECRSCHAETLTGPDAAANNPEMLSFSAAIHGWHAAYMTDQAEEACMTCHIALARPEDQPHDQPRPMFLRDFHGDRGLTCVRCHGFMEDHALALLKAEQEAGKIPAHKAMQALEGRRTDVGHIVSRLPWVQQPDCTGCHNFSTKPDLTSASAFNTWTPVAEGSSALFSRRKDFMSMVRCITCHGAPHAVYPARNPVQADRDNLPPLQYQEQAAPLGGYGNCALCHGETRERSAHHPLVFWTSTPVHLPAGAVASMPEVRFPHKAHVNVVSCNTCHHTGYEDGTSLRCTSSGCHDGLVPGPADQSYQASRRYFYTAFHGAFPSCLACHTESLAAGKPAGPTDCKACHQAPSERWEGN